MNVYGVKLKKHFLNTHSYRRYLSCLLDPDFYPFPVFTLHWFTPEFIDKKILIDAISQHLDKYTGIILTSLTSDFVNGHRDFSSIVTVEIQIDFLNQLLFESLVKDFEELIEWYDRIYEINKIFSN
ncbi:hypothetical protein [Priestia aryabhattai]